jgi:hypothetical protein
MTSVGLYALRWSRDRNHVPGSSVSRIMHDDFPRSEFSAQPITLEDFVQRPQWASLPFQIQLAVIHLWRSEQERVVGYSGDSVVALTPRIAAGEAAPNQDESSLLTLDVSASK